MSIYRPWGHISWVINRCPDVRWSILSTLSTEERCLAAWQLTRATGRLSYSYLAKIKDPPSPRYNNKVAQKFSDRQAEFLTLGGAESDIHEHSLFERYGDTIRWVDEFIAIAGSNIIVDITSFPKRYFFPIIKILLNDSRVRNLIAAYTIPKSYPEDEPLAENFEEWRAIPLFAGNVTGPSELIIVNVGYSAMGLPEELEQGGPDRLIKLIFPFPDYPSSYHKNMYFVRTIEKNLPPERIELKHVNTIDVSDAFDHLVSLTEHGRRRASFAPYGPKPISLAMCIFAVLTDSPVFYTQPRTYNPDYTIGVATIDNLPETYAYCLRLDNHDFFSIPTAI